MYYTTSKENPNISFSSNIYVNAEHKQFRVSLKKGGEFLRSSV